MKSKIINSLYVVLTLVLCLTLISCNAKADNAGIWENAVYTENAEIGEGEKTLEVKVLAEERSVVFTVHTDKTTLGEALLEHNIISGDQGTYGLYIKSVNGIIADYNTTNSYWSINKNGEYLMTGVDLAEIKDGESYEFVYIKN